MKKKIIACLIACLMKLPGIVAVCGMVCGATWCMMNGKGIFATQGWIVAAILTTRLVVCRDNCREIRVDVFKVDLPDADGDANPEPVSTHSPTQDERDCAVPEPGCSASSEHK